MVCEPAQRPLRICVVYSRLPFPMTRGDQLTVAHLLSYLHARGHDVDFFTLDTGGEMTAEQRRWLASVCRESYVFAHGKTSILTGVFSALLTSVPIQVGYFRNIQLAQRLLWVCLNVTRNIGGQQQNRTKNCQAATLLMLMVRLLR